MYVPTGQATPTYNGKSREGANLYTCSIVALNLDTGKMAWYYQTSPHDTHDWDATEVPILVDGTIDGRPRKLLAQTNRNGYFFLLDRTNGKPLVVKPFALSNSYLGVDNGVARAEPGQGGIARRDARVSDVGRRGQFSRAGVQSGDRACSTSTRPMPAAFSISRPMPTDPTGLRPRTGVARRHVRVPADGHRLPDRRAEVGAHVRAAAAGDPASSRASSPRAAGWSFRATRRAISSRSTRRPERFSGTRSSGRSSPTARRPTCSTAGSMWWWRRLRALFAFYLQ